MEQDIAEKVRQYTIYLDQEISDHLADAELESIHGSIAAEGRARVLQLARDRFYEIFPEMKPANYVSIQKGEADTATSH
jgi:hypothetical protein